MKSPLGYSCVSLLQPAGQAPHSDRPSAQAKDNPPETPRPAFSGKKAFLFPYPSNVLLRHIDVSRCKLCIFQKKADKGGFPHPALSCHKNKLPSLNLCIKVPKYMFRRALVSFCHMRKCNHNRAGHSIVSMLANPVTVNTSITVAHT